METLKSRKQILLTGAGFSKNFGGFLAKQMLDEIYNSRFLENRDNLKDFLIEGGDFESFYSDVMTDDKFSIEEKDAVKSAVYEAYGNLDGAIKGAFMDPDFLLHNWGGFMAENFCGGSGTVGLFFTLNQDLLMERNSNGVSPGVPSFRSIGLDQVSRISSANFIELPRDVARAVSDISSMNLSYIKLHGSYGWKSSDGSNQMVIGKYKSDLIEKEPILKFYFDVFKKAIAEGDKRILIIGYGFGDDHINEVLLDGVENHGLKIVVVGHNSIADFTKRIQAEHPKTLPLVKKIYKYFSYDMKDILTNNSMNGSFREKIEESLR